MKKSKFSVTFLIDNNQTTLKVQCPTSKELILDLDFTNEQLIQLMSRLACVEVDGEVSEHLERVGMKREHKDFTFPLLQKDAYNTDKAREIIKDACPDGWLAQTSFSSQNSFFTTTDGVAMARTTLYRWV